MRVNLSVAIVAMTRGRKSEFDWSTEEQGLLLSAFSYGYLFTQIPGGILATRIGGHRLYGAGIISTTLLTFLFPLASEFGLSALFVIRLLIGLCQGVVYPSLHAIWSKWAPPMERSRLNSLAFAGNYVGTVTMMPVSSFLAEKYGWRMVFYVTGMIGFSWYILWVLVVKESPQVDPHISPEEKKYIIDSLGESSQANKRPPVPWRDILTSTPLWACAVANFSNNWGADTLLTQLPTYLSDITDFSLNLNGLIAALPYLTMSIMMIPTSYLADRLQRGSCLTTTQVRKYFQCTGFFLQACCMLLAAYLIHPIYSTAALVLSNGLQALSVVGFATNVLDIGAPFAGILFGISNTLGSVPGICSPVITGFVVKNQVNKETSCS